MPNYTFESLSDADFEELVHDLLEAELSLSLESFTRGKDDGIDLRHCAANEAKLIVQCKHFAKSGLKTLLRHLRTEELSKIKILAPNRYLLCTSIGLTPRNK